MVNLETNKYYLKDKKWLLSEERAFDTETELMLDARLMIVDLNTMTMRNTDEDGKDIDDVWVYDWELIK